MNRQTIGFVVLIILLALTGALSLNLYLTEKKAHDRLDITTFPYQVGEWRGRDMTVTEKEYKILETRNLVSREYVNRTGEKLYLFIIYSETNRLVFHPPEVCLIGSGTTIVDKNVETAQSGERTFCVNKLDLEKNGVKEIVLNGYKAGNLYTDNFYLQQAYLIAHQVFGRRVPGATVRVSMHVVRDELHTVATLKQFLGETVKVIDKLSSD